MGAWEAFECDLTPRLLPRLWAPDDQQLWSSRYEPLAHATRILAHGARPAPMREAAALAVSVYTLTTAPGGGRIGTARQGTARLGTGAQSAWGTLLCGASAAC